MNKNVVIGIVVAIVIILLGVSFLGNNDRTDLNVDVNGVEQGTNINTDEQTSGMIVGENAVNVNEQRTGSTALVSFVMIEDRGYVVVHNASNPVANPGKVIGSSNLLLAGSTNNVSIALSEPLVEGKTYIAMLHLDNGDGTFNEATDPVAMDSRGNPVMMQFVASGAANVDTSVSL